MIPSHSFEKYRNSNYIPLTTWYKNAFVCVVVCGNFEVRIYSYLNCWKCFHLYLSDSVVNGFACTFAVLMSNMTMRWDIPIPFKPYAYVNLTCVSINSRPPATLRWYRGVHEVTRSSINNERVTRQNGNLLLAFKL